MHYGASGPAWVFPFRQSHLWYTHYTVGYGWLSDSIENGGRQWIKYQPVWAPSAIVPVWYRLVSATQSTNGLMSSLNAGNDIGFGNEANAAPLDSIFPTNVAMSCTSQFQNLCLMHPVSAGGSFHDGVSGKSVIRIAYGLVGTFQRVCGSHVLTLLGHLPKGRIIRWQFSPRLLVLAIHPTFCWHCV